MITISHPEKVLFPEDGITKGEMAAYYEMIAPVMLPQLRGRPVTMERFHRGIGEKGFIQKSLGKGTPEWIERLAAPLLQDKADFALPAYSRHRYEGTITRLMLAPLVRALYGRRLHYPIDHYLDDRAMWLEWRGIRILNYHRPMRRYMRALLQAGLQLTWFDEPEPTESTPPERASAYRRVPWFVVTEWQRPPQGA